jgi:hypothetical protein
LPDSAVDFGEYPVARKLVVSMDPELEILKGSSKEFLGDGAIRRDLRSRAVFVKLLLEQTHVAQLTVALENMPDPGRLRIVLLSFAQFEREVTGERIRDKIAASKRKGYEVRERQLSVASGDRAG